MVVIACTHIANPSHPSEIHENLGKHRDYKRRVSLYFSVKNEQVNGGKCACSSDISAKGKICEEERKKRKNSKRSRRLLKSLADKIRMTKPSGHGLRQWVVFVCCGPREEVVFLSQAHAARIRILMTPKMLAVCHSKRRLHWLSVPFGQAISKHQDGLSLPGVARFGQLTICAAVSHGSPMPWTQWKLLGLGLSGVFLSLDIMRMSVR